ncbi:DUF3899 domain-containing protein [Thalassobacillus hwangdonensis]|uniref:DUF3899 domain-containing protein n=1 Tax=Thalassobacillus hwangdonensis TaxID=546108 RepID=UPI0036DB0D58
MNIFYNKWMVLIFHFAAAYLITIATASAGSLVQFINILFYLSSFYLMVGLMMWVIKGGFFDAVTKSFRKTGSIFSKNQDYLLELEDKALPSDRISVSTVNFFLFQGILLLSGMGLLLIAYYS